MLEGTGHTSLPDSWPFRASSQLTHQPDTHLEVTVDLIETVDTNCKLAIP